MLVAKRHRSLSKSDDPKGSMEQCNVRTFRGTPCKNRRDGCFFHRTSRSSGGHIPVRPSRWLGQKKFRYFTNKGQEVCGAPTRGHASPKGAPCLKTIKEGERACPFHTIETYPHFTKPALAIAKKPRTTTTRRQLRAVKTTRPPRVLRILHREAQERSDTTPSPLDLQSIDSIAYLLLCLSKQ